MRTDFNLYIRASRDAFQIDSSRLRGLTASLESSNFICFSNDPTSIQVDRFTENGEIKIEFGYPSLGFARIRWLAESKKLTVELDELGLQSLFFTEDDGTIRISNRIETLEKAILNPRLSAKAINFFLVSGFLPTGWNFIENIQRVDQKSEWVLADNLKTHQMANWIQYSRESEPNVAEMVDLLRETLRLIEDEITPNEIRLSGGADTRIVSALYPTSLPAQVVQSPWVPDGEDLDVNLARAWAKENGQPFEVLQVSADRFHFFSGTSDRPTLTGLAGGEFLGGQFLRVIPATPDIWMLRAQRMLTKDGFEELNADPWVRRVSVNAQEWSVECARVFLQSTRSTIYQSLYGSWTTPYALMMRTVSPFTMPLFIKRFLSISKESLGDYEFYEKVFDEIGPRLKSVPLCSQFTLRRPELGAEKKWGRNPKLFYPSQSSMPTVEKIVEDLTSIFKDQKLGLGREQITALAADSGTRLALRSAYAWLRPRYFSTR